MITYLLFSLSLFLLTNATIITSDQTLSYTNQYEYGYWSITVERLNGTNPVTLCTTSNSEIPLVGGYFEVNSMTTNNVCYIQSSTYQISTIGVNHWNALKITRTEYPYPLIQLTEGATKDVFKKGENETKYYTFDPTSGTSLVQIFLVPQPPFLQSQTYSLSLLSTSCNTQTDTVSVSKFTPPQNNLENPGTVQLCTYGITGNYIFSLSISSPPNNDSYTIYFNTYPTSPTALTTTNGAQVQAPLYKTTWFQYTPSTLDTSFNTVTYTQTHPFRGNAVYAVYSTGSNLCNYDLSQLVNTVFNPTQTIVTNLQPCSDGILMSVTPLASLNQNDTEMDGIIFNTTSYVPPVTVISQKGGYSLYNNTVSSFFRVNIPLPSVGYILLNLSSPVSSKWQPYEVLFSGDYLVNNTNENCNVTSYMCKYENSLFCIINFPTCIYSGKTLYLTILNTQRSGGSFNIEVIDLNSPSTPLQSNNTGEINSVTKYFTFNNVPPSIISSSSSLNMAVYVPNLCEYPSSFQSSFPLVCIPSGILSVSSNTPTTYDITLQEYNPIPLVIDTGLTTTFPKNSLFLLFQLNVPSATPLTFTIAQNSNDQFVQFEVSYYHTDCSSEGFFFCFDEAQSSCSHLLGWNFPAGDYYFLVQANSFPQNSNIMINVTRNNPMCRNITQDLSFCAGNYPAKSGQLFQLTKGGVINAELDAINGYNELIAVWPMCNQTILDIACQTNFQGYICSNPGNELCADYCLNTLNSQCGDRTLCGEEVCLSVTGCFTTPSPPSSGHRTGLGLWVCFFVGLVGVAWF